ITIRTEAHDGSAPEDARPIKGPVIEVAVEDTGPGIPPDALQDIFQPFFTLKHRGTGLGLSVSRRIVEDHGGVLWAESPAGRGATFHVVLPLRPVGR
ncbi:MAG TPA: ATP-binding protein, partial [Candidatus Sulfotelmatobacter sp.]|nr:ATP-binding protein [Candidatus Sulfotelmatobacter sp.]